MASVIQALIVLACVSFVLAVVGSAVLDGNVMGIQSEAYSRASTNLALIAIALAVAKKKQSPAGS